MTQNETMQALRAHLPDAVIAEAFGLSRQRLHARLGPRPAGLREAPVAKPKPLPKHVSETPLPVLLVTWREHRGLTQEAAAALLGVNVWTLRGWEQGRGCGLENVLRIALYLLDKYQK